MKRHLLDVNLLLALVWPRHEDHAAAHRWFARSGRSAWATSPLTQLGVLRLLTNPAVTQGVVNAASALALVGEATRHPAHEFWPLNRDLASGLTALAQRMQGHQQWTDAVLLSQAAEKGGVLVTFDAALESLAGPQCAEHLLVLKSVR